MTAYYRPIPSQDAARPAHALTLAGGWTWFTQAERLTRSGPPAIVPMTEIPADILHALTGPRPAIAGTALDAPRLMGVLNITPDSFSDGGRFDTAKAARAQAEALVTEGADILDIGGESTRPGADPVPVDIEIDRTVPVIAALSGKIGVPISIDTRKAQVARAALGAGAQILNDVSALTHDPGMATLAADTNAPICLMHAQGDPKTMHQDPRYGNVLLDVYDQLAERLRAALAAGIHRDRIILDPGIGFGKTLDHNLTLLRRLSLFHALGCPILLGVSRKRFIGTIGNAPDPQDRMPGSVAVALHGVSQGMQILRVHDIKETKQALSLYRAVTGKGTEA